MALNFEIITQEDLNNLGISKYVQDMVFEGVNLEKMTIQDLKQLVDNLIVIITSVMQQKTASKGRGYSYSYKTVRKNTFKQTMVIGGLLVFKLRQFLLQESIYYSLGATDDNGQLFHREMSQDELWRVTTGKNSSGLRGSLSQKAIVLSRSLEQLNEEDFSQVGSLNLWPQIINLAFGGPAIKDPSDPTLDRFYQKDSNDKNVYVRYSEGRKKAKKNYYYRKNNEFLFYNQGWLYEWYLTYINAAAENEEKLQKSLKGNSIAPIIGKMDNVAGIAAGDFLDAKGRQVQAKFHNQKIISFNNILDLLQGIKVELDKLSKSPEEVKSAAKGFSSLFTEDLTVKNRLNKTYNGIIENQLLSLLKSAK